MPPGTTANPQGVTIYPEIVYAMDRATQLKREMSHPAEQHRRAAERQRRAVRRRQWSAVARRVTAPMVVALTASRPTRRVTAA
jgi:hypothetical protein